MKENQKENNSGENAENNEAGALGSIIDIIDPSKKPARKKNGKNEKVRCEICKNEFKAEKAVPAELVRPSLVKIIESKHAGWTAKSYICMLDLNKTRRAYIEHVLEKQKGDLSELDQKVIESLNKHEFVAKNLDAEFAKHLTFPEKFADRISAFGGSWKFITLFLLFIALWIGLNAYILISRIFDPYPFILLNLILSCVAALQAPVIMMSQNRREARDRMRGDYDYIVDLKAELEIKSIQEKLDYLVQHQWKQLLEIQQLQLEMLEEMHNKHK